MYVNFKNNFLRLRRMRRKRLCVLSDLLFRTLQPGISGLGKHYE